jgi:fatty acid synthase subunit beta
VLTAISYIALVRHFEAPVVSSESINIVAGFSILQVVKENPKQLTIHFGGTRGRDIRKNYMFMLFESTAPEDRILSRPIFKDIDEDTESYTYRSPQGLLYLTEFAQPALMVAARASFDTLRAKGLIQGQSFAGHSLGEYAALSSLANIMSIDQLVSVAFYRGLSMQANVDRDSLGHTNYAMCAVNPSRISKSKPDCEAV